jgi:hypothetical protein
MDILDNVIGMMGDHMMQAPTRASIFANVLRGGQPSFSEQPMAPTPQPEAMQQPAPPPPIANPNNYRLPRAMAQYQPPQMAQPAAVQATPQPMQPPQGMPQQQGPMTLGQDYQTLIQRQQANDEAMQRALQPADRTEAERAYRAHANSAMGPTVLALAAQNAGPGYAHMSDAWMRQAEEAQQPMKMAGGTMTSSGFIPDPEYAHALELKRLELKDASINKALEQNLTLSERARRRADQDAPADRAVDPRGERRGRCRHMVSGRQRPRHWSPGLPQQQDQPVGDERRARPAGAVHEVARAEARDRCRVERGREEGCVVAGPGREREGERIEGAAGEPRSVQAWARRVDGWLGPRQDWR